MSDALDNAAYAALLAIERRPRGHIDEHIGLLYQDPETGSVLSTNPQSTGQRSKATGAFTVPTGSARGIFHNHPAQGQHRSLRNVGGAEQFSNGDISTAKQLGLPSYIMTPKGMFLRYDPSSGDTDPVLVEYPIEEAKRRMMAEILNRSPDDPRGLRRLGGSPPLREAEDSKMAVLRELELRTK